MIAQAGLECVQGQGSCKTSDFRLPAIGNVVGGGAAGGGAGGGTAPDQPQGTPFVIAPGAVK